MYKIRWEILIMCASLALAIIAVLAIPNDFTTKMLKDQKEEKQKAQELAEQLAKQKEAEQEAEHEAEHGLEETIPENASSTNP